MIATAFEFLRQFTECPDQVEELVTQKIKYKYSDITPTDLKKIFESGVSGEYGKMYKADAQTILGWIVRYKQGKGSNYNYLSSPIMDKNNTYKSNDYPNSKDLWEKEVNKAYTAYLNGVNPEHFHHDLYNWLVLDGKIVSGTAKKFLSEGYLSRFTPGDPVNEEIKTAYRKAIGEYFGKCKGNGWNSIYNFVR